MTVPQFLQFLLLGRLLTWLLQTNGLIEIKQDKLQELRQCDLCTGFWVYLVLYSFMRDRIFPELPEIVEKPVVAALSAFLAHVGRLGWFSRFGSFQID
jgi:hypothetical protein